MLLHLLPGMVASDSEMQRHVYPLEVWSPLFFSSGNALLGWFQEQSYQEFSAEDLLLLKPPGGFSQTKRKAEPRPRHWDIVVVVLGWDGLGEDQRKKTRKD